MCLNIQKDDLPKIAVKNMPCYKSLSGRKSQQQYFTYYNYIRNREVSLHPIPIHAFYYPNATELKIEAGYHSRKPTNSGTRKNDLFIIPKGTEYYEGMENHRMTDYIDGYVSSTIIYIGKNNWFNRLIGKIFYGVDFQSEKQMRNEKRNL